MEEEHKIGTTATDVKDNSGTSDGLQNTTHSPRMEIRWEAELNLYRLTKLTQIQRLYIVRWQ
jgi:hypothetical protein